MRLKANKLHLMLIMESNKTVKIKYKVNYSLLLLSLQPLNRKRLHDLVREVDPNQTLDEDAEEVRRGWETVGFIIILLISY